MNMSKKTKRILIYSSILIIILILVIPRLSSKEKQSGRPGGRPGTGNMGVNVKGVVVKAEKFSEKVMSVGSIMADEEVELKSEISGKIVKILFKEGSPVRQGQLLVKINDNELQAQLNKAKYKLKLLEDNEYRQKVLFEKEAVSREAYEAVLNELNMTKADVELIQAQIDKTEIKAPFNGVIGLKSLSEGSYVSPQNIIAVLQKINPLKVDFSIPEKYAPIIKVGDKINFTLSGSNNIQTASIYAIEPKIDALTRSIKIRGMFTSTKDKFIPGAFVDVQLLINQNNDTYLLPTQSIVPELKGQKVFIYRSGKAIPQSVDLGVRTDKDVQILSGVSEGDTIITTGILQLKPNIPVKLLEVTKD